MDYTEIYSKKLIRQAALPLKVQAHNHAHNEALQDAPPNPHRNLPTLCLKTAEARIALLGQNNGAPNTTRTEAEIQRIEAQTAQIARLETLFPIDLSEKQSHIISQLLHLEEDFVNLEAGLTRWGKPTPQQILDCKNAYTKYFSALEKAIEEHGNLPCRTKTHFPTSLQLKLNTLIKRYGRPRIDERLEGTEPSVPYPQWQKFAKRTESPGDATLTSSEPEVITPQTEHYDIMKTPHSVFKNSGRGIVILEGLLRLLLLLFIVIGDLFKSMKPDYESFSTTKGFANSIKLCFDPNTTH